MSIIFNEADHSYYLNGKPLISVTTLMRKHGLSKSFAFVKEDVLTQAQNRGNLIHKEIELFLKKKKRVPLINLHPSVIAFLEICKEHDIDWQNFKSEQIVHNDFLAGTIDLFMSNGTIIGDIKSAKNIDIEACRWQLSLYAYLLNKAFDKMYIFQISDKYKLIEIQPISIAEIGKLFEAEKNCELYKPKTLQISDEFCQDIIRHELDIANFKNEIKAIEAFMNHKLDIIKNLFEQENVKSFESPDKKLLMTYVAQHSRVVLDSKKVKEQYAHIYDDCSKTSDVKASLKITIRS